MKMTGNKKNKLTRPYKVEDIAVVFAVVVLIVVLFDATGLKAWANRLEVGEPGSFTESVRQFYLGVTEPLASVTSKTYLDRPRNGLRDGFFKIVGKQREAGFLLADSEVDFPDPVQLSSGETEIGSWMNSPNVGWSDEDEPGQPAKAQATTGVYSQEHPLQVLLIGDSMMGDGFGTMIERAIEADPAMTSHRFPRHSSGLSRPDYYNWPAQVSEIFSNYEFDAVVVILGTNDAQNFESDGVVYERFSDGWSDIYSIRLDRFLKQLAVHTQRTYWVGMPIMRESGYNDRMMNLNEFFISGCEANAEATYISSADILSGSSGEFMSYLDVNGVSTNVRNTDGIHLTRAGGGLVADEVMELLREDFNFQSDTNEELPPVF